MPECHQGQRNQDDIKALFKLVEERNSEIMDVKYKQIEMAGDVKELKTLLITRLDYIEQRVEEDNQKVKDHLENSEPRITEIDRNTRFRNGSMVILLGLLGKLAYDVVSLIKS